MVRVASLICQVAPAPDQVSAPGPAMRESSTVRSPFRTTGTAMVREVTVALHSLGELLTVSVPVPREDATPMPIVPAFKVSPPLYVCVPVPPPIVNAPDPFLTTLPPVVPVMIPAPPLPPKVSPAGLLIVSAFAPRATVPPVPLTDLIVSLNPFRSNVPPATSVITQESGTTPDAPSLRTPDAFTLALPFQLFAGLLSSTTHAAKGE